MRRNHYILTGILVIAALLRLWNLSAGDTLGDEASYAFRAVGMLDFDEAGDQTTPLEWFDPHIPSWTVLSFHDHPPLVFFMQHVFMQVFGGLHLPVGGASRFWFRLPSALFGIASVYLLYCIGRRLYTEETGLVAAAIFAITVNHVAISRIGIQEAQVIFFMLLAAYFFLRALEKDIYLLGVGIALGFALLTKYTTGILIPVFFSYLIIYRREYFFKKKLWIAAALAMLIFSPVFIYNYKLYEEVGHFDFQLSYVFGQDPDVWRVAPGKQDFPTLASRFGNVFSNLFYFNSWAFLILVGSSLLGFLFVFAKNSYTALREHAFLVISLFWISLLILMFIGPSFRFLSMLTPFMALGIGVTAVKVFHSKTVVAGTVSAIVIFFEIFYSINSQILYYPKGPDPWAFSRVRYENYNWGYNELEAFFGDVLEGKMPAFAFEQQYHFIEEIHQEALAKAAREGREPFPALFVYDKNVQSAAQLWVLDRLQIYYAWPIIPLDTYARFLAEKGEDYFRRSGVAQTYFITPTGNIPWKREPNITTQGVAFERQLNEQGLAPTRVIKNKRGEDAFRVYTF